MASVAAGRCLPASEGAAQPEMPRLAALLQKCSLMPCPPYSCCAVAHPRAAVAPSRLPHIGTPSAAATTGPRAAHAGHCAGLGSLADAAVVPAKGLHGLEHRVSAVHVPLVLQVAVGQSGEAGHAARALHALDSGRCRQQQRQAGRQWSSASMAKGAGRTCAQQAGSNLQVAAGLPQMCCAVLSNSSPSAWLHGVTPRQPARAPAVSTQPAARSQRNPPAPSATRPQPAQPTVQEVVGGAVCKRDAGGGCNHAALAAARQVQQVEGLLQG